MTAMLMLSALCSMGQSSELGNLDTQIWSFYTTSYDTKKTEAGKEYVEKKTEFKYFFTMGEKEYNGHNYKVLYRLNAKPGEGVSADNVEEVLLFREADGRLLAPTDVFIAYCISMEGLYDWYNKVGDETEIFNYNATPGYFFTEVSCLYRIEQWIGLDGVSRRKYVQDGNISVERIGPLYYESTLCPYLLLYEMMDCPPSDTYIFRTLNAYYENGKLVYTAPTGTATPDETADERMNREGTQYREDGMLAELYTFVTGGEALPYLAPSQPAAPSATYDLQGRRASDAVLQKGIYIRNGKKYLR